MIENEIHCYINGFFKCNISKNNSYIVGNNQFSGKIYTLNLRNERKRIFARVIMRCKGWRKIAKKTGKIIIKSGYDLLYKS